MKFKTITFLILQWICHSATGLEITLAQALLPEALASVGLIFDGEDAIYIFEGLKDDRTFNADIYKYTLSSDTIALVGRDPTPGAYKGNTFSINSQGIIHSFEYDTLIVTEFNPFSQQARIVLNTTISLEYGIAFAQIDDNKVILLGGRYADFFGDVLELDLGSMEVNYTRDLFDEEILFQSCMAFDQENKILYASGRYYNHTSFIVGYDVRAQSFQMVFTGLTRSMYYSTAVWIQEKMWVTDAYGFPGVEIFDPFNLTHTLVPVDGIGGEMFFNRASVYVEKLGRIYLFGGFDSKSLKNRKEIWFIDVGLPTTTDSTSSTTSLPPIFSCLGKADGFYPHPSNCESFLTCLDEELAEYECPHPLLFDPILLECKYAEQVICELSCVGKPDGEYKHPNDCSLFLICLRDLGEIFQCPEPLLFDNKKGRCNFPHLVDCTNW